MSVLLALWSPILLSSVFVFVASFIIHMALPWHKGDYLKLPQEDKVMDALRPFSIPPGDYVVPRCFSTAEMKSAEFAEKLKKGPVMGITVMPNGPFHMGKSLLFWFLYLIVVNYLTAYIVGHALPYGAKFAVVFRFAGVASFMGYAAAIWQMSIWYRRSWLTTIKTTVDGLIYAGLTAGTFGWLWMR
jgi:hypothetical protein